MKFTDRILEKALPIWRRNHNHPFVREIGNGTLDEDKFRFYMVQDYLYLIQYVKIFAIAVVKADELKHMEKFAKILEGHLHFEMELHRSYAARFGITNEELESAKPAPTVLAYTHYMLHVAQNGTLAEVMAAVLPCAWSYWEIGKELNEIPGAAEHPKYGDWVKTYSSKEFGEMATWCMELMNEQASGKSEKEWEKLEEIFIHTTKFEYMFWDMAYGKQMWPGDE
ncbi:thiaminase II [Bacillus sp. FJAT-50079]|uniref:thiaminase II n=1 Tax=Bacillus sp. FJAT-50079 TaxID=2833577 RepID=UPI001BC94780|nr:thiaminase II [Bacillus sp. FJAT-50079]MBS4210387.1 thiaminase II [Bacillus sp. FJAT-50079]